MSAVQTNEVRRLGHAVEPRASMALVSSCGACACEARLKRRRAWIRENGIVGGAGDIGLRRR